MKYSVETSQELDVLRFGFDQGMKLNAAGDGCALYFFILVFILHLLVMYAGFILLLRENWVVLRPALHTVPDQEAPLRARNEEVAA
jgi:hypothetical protein